MPVPQRVARRKGSRHAAPNRFLARVAVESWYRIGKAAKQARAEERSVIITDVKPYPVWGGNRNFFFVKVETDEGHYGIGEGGLTWRQYACAEAVNHFKPLLIGQDASRIEHLWQ